jgi:hypothetical protein
MVNCKIRLIVDVRCWQFFLAGFFKNLLKLGVSYKF